MDVKSECDTVRRVGRRWKSWLFAASALFIAQPALQMVSAEAEADSANAYRVVDCLLPGRVRQLGSRKVYMGRRQLARLTAKTCEIRGGEYTLEDRASVSGSLKAWLPLAMEGNARAQNFVGELSERGENGQPDFAMARLWYTRAADQGLAAARFNLARLHENGLGGPVDRKRAGELYLEASGIDASLRDAVTLVDPGEIETLEMQIARRDETIARQKVQIGRLEGEVSELEAEARNLRADSERTAGQIADLEASLSAQRRELAAALSDQSTGIAQRHPDSDALARQRADLAARQDELAHRENALERREVELAEKLGQAAGQDHAVRQEHAALARALHDAHAQLEQLRQARAQAVSARDAALERLAGERSEIDGKLAELAGLEEALSRREAALADREASMGAQLLSVTEERRSLAEMRAELAVVREDLSRRSAAHGEKLRQLDTRADELAAREQALAQAEARLAAQQAQLQAASTRSTELAGQREQILLERAALESERSGLAAARQDINARVADITRREQQFASDLSQLEARSQALAQRERQMIELEYQAASERERADRAERQLADAEARLAQVSQVIGGQRSLVPGSEIAPATPEPAMDIDFGDYHALLIGNENYTDANWPDLQTPHEDVEQVGRILNDKYGFDVTILKDATRLEMLEAIDEVSSRMDADDNLVIYFAGHGQYIDKRGRGFWEPVDSVAHKTRQSISFHQVNDVLSLTKAKKVLVIADSCYSGVLTRSIYTQVSEDAASDAKEQVFRQLASQRSRMAMTSGGEKPVADGLGNGHSMFARALMMSLEDNQRVVTGRDIHANVFKLVMAKAVSVGFDQQPAYDEIPLTGHEGGDFLFVPT